MAIFDRAVRCLSLFILALVFAVPSLGQSNAVEQSYTLAFPRPDTHLYEVKFRIDKVTSPQIEIALPVWTPGSYLVREFARHVRDFAATDEKGAPLDWRKVDKASWRIDARSGTVIASYRVYANDLTVRTSHLDSSHAYFNGANIFMYVKGAEGRPMKLRIDPPAGWRVTTPLALAPDADGYYHAPNYDVLADSPTEIGKHNLLEFQVRGKPHRIAIWGEANYDETRLKEDFAKIVEEGARIFGGLPYEHYTFILHFQPGIGGGLEHLNSTTCQGSPRVFAARKGYIGFLGLISHEFFHLWNVKRIRPLALGPFDYQQENYTNGLWVSEGITDYYSQQLLIRAGLISQQEYLDEIANNIRIYESTPGRLVQTAESASFDSWIKYYRPDENSINTGMSYYLRGDLLGMLLDLEIRRRTNGAKTIDDVMRLLMDSHSLPKPGFTDAELKAAFEKVAGGDLNDFFKRHVSGNEELDFNRFFKYAGLELARSHARSKPANLKPGEAHSPGVLGLTTRAAGDRVIINNVLAGMPAYEGGLNAGDELLAIDGRKIDAANVADQFYEIPEGRRVTISFFRREKLMTLELAAGKRPFDSYAIVSLSNAAGDQLALRRGWIGGQKD